MLNREQFISTILKYLKRVPYEERIEVERYYNEIFDEAGIGGNDLVPESFGNPREIALDLSLIHIFFLSTNVTNAPLPIPP